MLVLAGKAGGYGDVAKYRHGRGERCPTLVVWLAVGEELTQSITRAFREVVKLWPSRTQKTNCS